MGALRGMGTASSLMSTIMSNTVALISYTTFAMYTGIGGNAIGSADLARTSYYVMSINNVLQSPLRSVPFLFLMYAESTISWERIQTFLALPETVRPASTPNPDHPDLAIRVRGSFAWADEEATKALPASLSLDYKKRGPPGGKPKRNGPPGGKPKRGPPGGRPQRPQPVDVVPVATEIDVSSLPVVRDLDISIKDGETVGVAGPVGAGKTSLLCALLGELYSVGDSEAAIYRSAAYCGQKAAIFNSTLRNNILFGLDYDESRYNHALDVCCLRPDLSQFSAGDMTEIGERGVTLSGGQKQRIALARAVYSESDIYLLDDPLSAVDAHVGRAIWVDVIIASLKAHGKTVILVTHQVQYLPQCDRVILLNQGVVSFNGTFADLLERKESLPASLSSLLENSSQNTSTVPSACPSEAEPETVPAAVAIEDKEKQSKGRLGQKETTATGSIGLSVYRALVQFGGSTAIVVFMSVMLVLGQIGPVLGDIFLSYWSGLSESTTSTMILIYTGIVIVGILVCYIGQWVLALFFVNVSGGIHGALTKAVLSAPMHLYDTTPLGQILNRFSKDMDSVDTQISMRFSQFLMAGLMLVYYIVVIVTVAPVVLIVILVVAGFYVFFFNLYRGSVRELKRMSAVARSPVLALASETLTSVQTIRAYGLENHFREHNRNNVNKYTRLYIPTLAIGSWLRLRLDTLSSFVNLAVALSAVLFTEAGSTSAVYIGLALTYAANVFSMSTSTVDFFTQLEAEMSSVERIFEYIEELPKEAPRRLPGVSVPEEWPAQGAIQFNDVVLRYRPELDPVLKGISISIKPGEKVGLVGRTGAGKSTLAVALMRLVEAESGSICMDGLDLSTVGIHDVRGNISSIPQDAFLFAGSLRANLDPIHQLRHEQGLRATERAGQKSHKGDLEAELAEVAVVGDAAAASDDVLWAALERVQLREYVEANGGLGMILTDNGANLSEGQRQLVCMARALVEDNKVILMDEATASVDQDTDAAIQHILRECFGDKTILVIAHRLITIMDFDRILVMDDGHVGEFDTPANLLRREGLLYGLVQETGPQMAAELCRLAMAQEAKIQGESAL
ncbi:hypothetical protein KIPB_000818 [Kipferlia bialata]|uniref:Uncharacterized protein n=1 Tax=Kipferlia bialata TaxID=797122 RepID=A0A9K3CPU4_9EUKA|nr:hypothetical protein KIPB_000818 [Kipferlia bialata]|eukprot:g818.t1